MQDDVRASLEDLAIRWETPRGRELKTSLLRDAKESGGAGMARILKDFIYVSEVPDGRDLRCITLDGEDLAGAVFYKADLSWASLASCNLRGADFKEAILKRANMSSSDLSMSHFEEADCSRTDFSRSNLDGAHFRRAKLTGAVLEGSDASRASFEGANASKTNWRSAVLEQTSFNNADVSQSNFDSGGLDRAAARPSKDRDVVIDMEREEFERKVGLHAITSRTTKRFKGLDAIRQAQALLELGKGGAESLKKNAKGGGEGAGPYFGASVLGTRRMRPADDPGLSAATPTEGEGGSFGSEIGATDSGIVPLVDAGPAPAPTRAFRPTQVHARAPGSTAGGPPSSGFRRPGPPPSGRTATTGLRRPVPPPPTGSTPPAMQRPGSGVFRRPPPAILPAPAPAPKLPVAAFDPSAPEPTTDWAKAIGQLMGLKSAITKIAIELNDRTQVIYTAPPPDQA